MNPRFAHFLSAVVLASFVVVGCSRDETGVFDPAQTFNAKSSRESGTGVLRGAISLDNEKLEAATGASIFVYRTLDDFRNHVADLLRATELLPSDDPIPEYFVIEVPTERRPNHLAFEVSLAAGDYLLVLWKDTQPNGMMDADDPFFFVCTDDCPAPVVVEVRAGVINWIHSRPDIAEVP